MGVLAVVAFALFAVLFGRLWYLQVMVAPRFESREGQPGAIIQIAPTRSLLDRNGVVLAENKLTTVSRRQSDIARPSADRALREDGPDTRQTLFNSKRATSRHTGLSPVAVDHDQGRGHRRLLEGAARGVPRRRGDRPTERFYAYGPSRRPRIGYIGNLRRSRTGYAHECGKDLTASTCYQLSDTVGVSGVEQVFERELRGRPGYRKLEVDAKGRVVQVLKDVAPVPGNDVVLTIDAQIQQLAEQALAVKLQEVASRGPIDRETNLPTGARYTAPTGVVVVEDPSNGQILAMASYPTFDPREFTHGISQERSNQLYSKEQNSPLLNRATQGEYAPASTFKLVTATATISYGLKSPADVYTDTGKFDLHDLEKECSGLCIFHNAGNQVTATLICRKP